MKAAQIYQLQKGDKVSHAHYGICTVDGVMRGFGPLLIPDSAAGLHLLSQESKMPVGTPWVETAYGLVTTLMGISPTVKSTGNPDPTTGTYSRF